MCHTHTQRALVLRCMREAGKRQPMNRFGNRRGPTSEWRELRRIGFFQDHCGACGFTCSLVLVLFAQVIAYSLLAAAVHVTFAEESFASSHTGHASTSSGASATLGVSSTMEEPAAATSSLLCACNASADAVQIPSPNRGTGNRQEDSGESHTEGALSGEDGRQVEETGEETTWGSPFLETSKCDRGSSPSIGISVYGEFVPECNLQSPYPVSVVESLIPSYGGTERDAQRKRCSSLFLASCGAWIEEKRNQSAKEVSESPWGLYRYERSFDAVDARNARVLSSVVSMQDLRAAGSSHFGKLFDGCLRSFAAWSYSGSSENAADASLSRKWMRKIFSISSTRSLSALLGELASIGATSVLYPARDALPFNGKASLFLQQSGGLDLDEQQALYLVVGCLRNGWIEGRHVQSEALIFSKVRTAFALSERLILGHTSADVDTIVDYVNSPSGLVLDALTPHRARSRCGAFDLDAFLWSVVGDSERAYDHASSAVVGGLLARMELAGLKTWIFRASYLGTLSMEFPKSEQEFESWRWLCVLWYLQRVYQFSPGTFPEVYGLGERRDGHEEDDAERTGESVDPQGRDRNVSTGVRAARTSLSARQMEEKRLQAMHRWNRAPVGEHIFRPRRLRRGASRYEGDAREMGGSVRERPPPLGLPDEASMPWLIGRKWLAPGLEPARSSRHRGHRPVGLAAAAEGATQMTSSEMLGGVSDPASRGGYDYDVMKRVAPSVCTDVATAYLQHLTDTRFAAAVVDPSIAENVRAIATELRDEFARMLLKARWVPRAKRAALSAKMLAVKITIGNVRTRAASAVQEMSLEGRMLGDVLSVSKAVIGAQISGISIGRDGAPAEDQRVVFTADTVNAYYDPSRNSMHVLPAMLQPPFASARWDRTSLLAAVGSIVAHELAHAVDLYGLQFDASGGVVLPSSELHGVATSHEFSSGMAALRAAYTRTTVHGNTHDGAKTADENYADLLGTRVAHSLLRRENSSLQVSRAFWTSYAQLWCTHMSQNSEKMRINNDVHSLPEMRVDVPAFASSHFRRAFGCSEQIAPHLGTLSDRNDDDDDDDDAAPA